MHTAAPHNSLLTWSGLAVALLLALPAAVAAQAAAPDSLAADLDSDVPLSSKILPTPPAGEDDGPELLLQADALVTSHYMAQGIDSSFEHQVAQSSLTAARGPWSATLWNNYDMHDRGVNEVDVTCAYTHTLSALALSVGYQHMGYPRRVDAAAGNELTLNAALGTALSPALNVHYDFDAGDGLYLAGQLSQALPGHLTVTGQLFNQAHYFQMSGLTAGALTLGYVAEVGNLTLKPAVTRYQGVASGDFRGEAAVPSRWVAGLGLSTRL